MSWSLRVRTATGSTNCAATCRLSICNMPAVLKRYLRNWTIPGADNFNASAAPAAAKAVRIADENNSCPHRVAFDIGTVAPSLPFGPRTHHALNDVVFLAFLWFVLVLM